MPIQSIKLSPFKKKGLIEDIMKANDHLNDKTANVKPMNYQRIKAINSIV